MFIGQPPMYKSNMAEYSEKQTAWICRLDQYPQWYWTRLLYRHELGAPLSGIRTTDTGIRQDIYKFNIYLINIILN